LCVSPVVLKQFEPMYSFEFETPALYGTQLIV